MEEATAENCSRPEPGQQRERLSSEHLESTGPRGWTPDPSGGQWPVDREGDGDEAGSVHVVGAAHTATAADGTPRPR